MADDSDELRRRASEMENRTVTGAAPIAGGGTMASSGAFDTAGGGDLGGPGSRDPGDSTSHLRDPVREGGAGQGGGAPNEQQDAGGAHADLDQQRHPTSLESSEKS